MERESGQRPNKLEESLALAEAARAAVERACVDAQSRAAEMERQCQVRDQRKMPHPATCSTGSVLGTVDVTAGAPWQRAEAKRSDAEFALEESRAAAAESASERASSSDSQGALVAEVRALADAELRAAASLRQGAERRVEQACQESNQLRERIGQLERELVATKGLARAQAEAREAAVGAKEGGEFGSDEDGFSDVTPAPPPAPFLPSDDPRASTVGSSLVADVQRHFSGAVASAANAAESVAGCTAERARAHVTATAGAFGEGPRPPQGGIVVTGEALAWLTKLVGWIVFGWLVGWLLG